MGRGGREILPPYLVERQSGVIAYPDGTTLLVYMAGGYQRLPQDHLTLTEAGSSADLKKACVPFQHAYYTLDEQGICVEDGQAINVLALEDIALEQL
jgi:hypothetical protein